MLLNWLKSLLISIVVLKLSLESFREYCNQSKFYFFNSPEDFDKRIDWGNRSVKNIIFERGLVDEGVNNIPTRYSAYGTKHKPEVTQCALFQKQKQEKQSELHEVTTCKK